MCTVYGIAEKRGSADISESDTVFPRVPVNCPDIACAGGSNVSGINELPGRSPENRREKKSKSCKTESDHEQQQKDLGIGKMLSEEYEQDQ